MRVRCLVAALFETSVAQIPLSASSFWKQQCPILPPPRAESWQAASVSWHRPPGPLKATFHGHDWAQTQPGRVLLHHRRKAWQVQTSGRLQRVGLSELLRKLPRLPRSLFPLSLPPLPRPSAVLGLKDQAFPPSAKSPRSSPSLSLCLFLSRLRILVVLHTFHLSLVQRPELTTTSLEEKVDSPELKFGGRNLCSQRRPAQTLQRHSQTPSYVLGAWLLRIWRAKRIPSECNLPIRNRSHHRQGATIISCASGKDVAHAQAVPSSSM